MGSVLDTLEIRFEADLTGVGRGLKSLSDQLRGLDGQGAQAGGALAAGLKNGIAAGIPSVRNAAKALAEAAASTLRQSLNIHSPSRVTEEIGRMFAKGFDNGVSGALDGAAAAARTLGRQGAGQIRAVGVSEGSPGDIAGEIARAVSEGVAKLSVVVPINVDGRELGEAAIRGINQVTKSTGRIALRI